MTRIIIGVDGSERSEDALAFGRMLAVASGAPVTLATAYPWDVPTIYHGVGDYDDFLREEAEATLARRSDPLRDLPSVETRAIPDSSPARALQQLAEEQDAGIIVLGSSHRGRLGRVLPGSTAERLLHGAQCPVAVVPNGFRTEPEPFGVIACGWDATPASDAALVAAEDLARIPSGSLRVIRVHERHHSYAYAAAMSAGYVRLLEEVPSSARQELEDRVAHLAASVGAEATFVVGNAGEALVGISERVDLMVVGSRGYGPLQAVLLGAVSGKVIRGAACPVIVVPRGASTSAASVFASVAHEHA